MYAFYQDCGYGWDPDPDKGQLKSKNEMFSRAGCFFGGLEVSPWSEKSYKEVLYEVCSIFTFMRIITIFVPLILKMRDVIFLRANYFMGHFEGATIFWPLNCPERSEGQFRVQKSRGPFKISQEMAHKLIGPKTKNNIPHFLKSVVHW